MFGLSKPALIAIAAGLLIAATGTVVWVIYHKGEVSGSADVKAKVATETVKKLDDARLTKEKIDAEVGRTPYADKPDQLR